MKVLSGILKALSYIVYLIIILSLLIAAPLLFGNRPVVILSGSMEPAYPVGGITYYKSAAFDEIAAGDAITFKIGDGSLATHRVTAVNEEEQSFTTKGDHNDSEDKSPVPYSKVVGKAVRKAIPYAGYFVNSAKHWYVIAACALILLLDMLLSSDKKKKEFSIGEALLEDLQKPSEQDSNEL